MEPRARYNSTQLEMLLDAILASKPQEIEFRICSTSRPQEPHSAHIYQISVILTRRYTTFYPFLLKFKMSYSSPPQIANTKYHLPKYILCRGSIIGEVIFLFNYLQAHLQTYDLNMLRLKLTSSCEILIENL